MLSLVVAVALSAPFTAPTRVDEVRVSGLWITREATVLRELTFAPGDEVTPVAWELFEARLWNLGIFSRVKLTLVEREGRRVAAVELEDRFPLGPVFRANFGGGQFFLWAGAAHINLLGRALIARGFYERFGSQNGGHLEVTDPRLFNQRLNALFEAEWLSRPQPEFIVRRALLRTSFDFNVPGTIDDRFRLGVRLEGTSDELFAVPGSPAALPVNSKALLVGVFTRLGRLDVDRLRYANGSLELRADLQLTTDPAHPVAGLFSLEGQYFWKLGDAVNLGGRVLGAFERNARPQDRYYIGGLDRVRGYAYSEIRAQAYGIANLELRAVAFDSMWFAVMPVGFFDCGVAWRDTGEVQPLASIGVGVRLLVPRLYRFGVRLEVAQPLAESPVTRPFTPGINFGIWHFW